MKDLVTQAESLAANFKEDGSYNAPYSETAKHPSGMYRFAIVENVVYKVAFGKNGRQCNQAEFDFYVMTTDSIRAKLAKPLYVSRNGNVIVMERLKMKENMNGPEYNAFISDCDKTRIELIAEINDAYGFRFKDSHDGNFGRNSNGDVVCSDYGSIAYDAECRATHQYLRDELRKVMRRE